MERQKKGFLAKAPFRKIGRIGHGTLQEKRKTVTQDMFVDMLTDVRFESWRDSLCNEFISK